MLRRVVLSAAAAGLLVGPSLVAGVVSTGPAFSEALTNGVVAWGANGSGQLGDGSTSGTDVPVLNSLAGVQQVSAGDGFALALLDNGTVMAWGDNTYGELGVDPATTAYSDVPLQVSALSGVSQIQAGGTFDLAVIPYGTVVAWGDNSDGQLGLDPGATPYRYQPVQVSTDLRNNVRAVAAGDDFALALMGGPMSGTVMAWGDNTYGELGVDPSTTAYSDVPLQVSGLGAVSAIAAGGAHGLAILPQGEVDAWGDNTYGQLGVDPSTTAYSDVPLQVSGLADVGSIRAGETQSLALLRTGTVMAWGGDSSGQLGDDSTVDSYAPVEAVNLRGATSISAGGSFGLAKAMTVPSVIGPRARATASIGAPFSHSVKVRSLPMYSTITESGDLPDGIAFTDNGNDTATLSGTPVSGSAGTYLIQISASNGLGSPAVQSLTLVVKDPVSVESRRKL